MFTKLILKLILRKGIFYGNDILPDLCTNVFFFLIILQIRILKYNIYMSIGLQFQLFKNLIPLDFV